MQDTYAAKAIIQSLTHTGSQEDCRAWTANLLGCKARVTGKDGKTYVVGIVTYTEFKNLSTVRF